MGIFGETGESNCVLGVNAGLAACKLLLDTGETAAAGSVVTPLKVGVDGIAGGARGDWVSNELVNDSLFWLALETILPAERFPIEATG